MDSVERIVAGHYGSGQVMARIRAALAGADLREKHPGETGLSETGLSKTGLTAIDLAPLDQLHPGGAEATEALLAQLGLGPDTRALDLGCGIGGPARMIADRYGASVTGVDLIAEYVEAARELSAMVGLGDRLRFLQGSVTDLPVADGSADLALLQHVGMNVADKPALFREAARALAPGGTFALFEAMRGPDPSPLCFPLPWAASPESSFVAAPADYRAAAAAAGFVLRAERDRSAYAAAFFRRLLDRLDRAGPPSLGLHALLGPEGRDKVSNYLANLDAGRLAPVEMIFARP